MKRWFSVLPVLVFISNHSFAFQAQITPIPTTIQAKMERYSWRASCPLPLKDLRLVQVSYWGFDQKSHQGYMIINKVLAKEVVAIFKALYKQHFPIEHMRLMDDYQGNDDAAMAANNTSAFNCRAITGHPGYFSQHSYGRAIDINPKINPYVGKKGIQPPEGSSFVDRNQVYPGKITKKSYIYRLFKHYGWDWGGHWFDVQDYQHFEKRANGEKRNPYGYIN